MGSLAKRLRALDTWAERTWEPRLDPYLGIFDDDWTRRVRPGAAALAILGFLLADAPLIGLAYWSFGVGSTEVAHILVSLAYWPLVWRFYLAKRLRMTVASRDNRGWIGLAVIVILVLVGCLVALATG